ncbi:polysaccharide biosynthesis C-terminal domain-containing protein [Clostridium algidicarnis]|uniref:polysaccharide biosynthesis C-terminal domain-containing protein n=1 Tax=Clostridium algidicarnis TaxID=37659 RepID=UPI001CF3824E|nr:polysaccharide biosynthesis C-terminal domain-containing protein [Clostridium algidicarnis]MCB2287712.1 polysaccharide biosynthesis C-terminal domain-containing protein [Clostridium algidicarnis]
MGKYILLYFQGSSKNEVLALPSKFPALVTIIAAIIFLAWTENIIREFDSDDRDIYFTKVFKLFMKFNFSATACLLPLIKIYNIITISGEFVDLWKYIPLLIVGTLFSSLAAFLGTVYTASMKTKDAFTTTIVAGITNLVLPLLFIPFMSTLGVILANTLSFVVLFLVRIRSINKIINFKIDSKESISSIVLVSIFVIVYYIKGILLQGILFVILSICALLINKQIIVEIL